MRVGRLAHPHSPLPPWFIQGRLTLCIDLVRAGFADTKKRRTLVRRFVVTNLALSAHLAAGAAGTPAAE